MTLECPFPTQSHEIKFIHKGQYLSFVVFWIVS